jgi:glutamyl-tRNA synthetase
MSKRVRTRFAPSPTGGMHIGGFRTAMLNYFYAKKHGGDFILRIEDTDRTRLEENSITHIKESLEWLGITPDESPWKEGDYAPYTQSEREYRNYADQLIESGHAYYAFDTPEELKAKRDEWDKLEPKPCYNYLTRMEMNNSLSLPEEVWKEKIKTEPYVIRWKWNEGVTTFKDEAKGKVKFNHDILDDKVLFKSDGFPSYHLANVVDDYTMDITHVIRGDEWLNSTPLHIALYNAFRWTVPTFVHCPLLLTPDGAKISKRNAHKYGLSVFALDYEVEGELVEGYKTMGYESGALLDFLITLGYTHKEMSKEHQTKGVPPIHRVIANFDLANIGKSGAKVFKDKLDYYNTERLKKIDDHMLLVWMQKNCDFIPNYHPIPLRKIRLISEACKDRALFKKDVFDTVKHFFKDPEYKEDFKSKVTDEALNILKDFINSETLDLKEIFFRPERIKQAIYDICEEKELKMGKIMPTLRYCITGGWDSPDLVTIMYVRGLDKTRDLINKI